MLDDLDFECALAAARDGFPHDWPRDDRVAEVLDAVIVDPSDAHIDAARAAWRASAPSA